MTLKCIGLGVLAVAAYGCSGLAVDGNQRQDQVGNTVVGQALARAKDEKCMEYLKQVRQGIQVYMTSSDTPPQSLTELKFPAELLICPIDKKPYDYDSATGTVKCKHPGHQKY